MQEETDSSHFFKSSQEIANEVGVSFATIERVKPILEQGTPEQIKALLNRNEQGGEGPGIRTVCQQVQSEKLKSKLSQQQQQQQPAQLELEERDNLRLFNKDFRTISMKEIPDES
jgi:hypothetical protein